MADLLVLTQAERERERARARCAFALVYEMSDWTRAARGRGEEWGGGYAASMGFNLAGALPLFVLVLELWAVFALRVKFAF